MGRASPLFEVRKLLSETNDSVADDATATWPQSDANEATESFANAEPTANERTRSEATYGDDEPPSPDPFVGRIIHNHRLIKLLGEGAGGMVFLAEHVHVERLAAFKLLRAEGSTASHARLLREAALLAKLQHPNVVQLYDFGFVDERMPFLVLEFVDGPTLRTVLSNGVIPIERARRLGLDIARGLAAMHDRGITHRDLKPANVIVAQSGRQETAKIVDLGLGRRDESTRLTRAGALLGTPLYMAPEQARGEEAGPPADAYALGAVLFVLLTGSPPFLGSSLREVLEKHKSAPVPELPDLDGLGPIVRKLLSKSAAERPTCAYVAQFLESLVRVSSSGSGALPAQSQARVHALSDPGQRPVSASRDHVLSHAAVGPRQKNSEAKLTTLVSTPAAVILGIAALGSSLILASALRPRTDPSPTAQVQIIAAPKVETKEPHRPQSGDGEAQAPKVLPTPEATPPVTSAKEPQRKEASKRSIDTTVIDRALTARGWSLDDLDSVGLGEAKRRYLTAAARHELSEELVSKLAQAIQGAMTSKEILKRGLDRTLKALRGSSAPLDTIKPLEGRYLELSLRLSQTAALDAKLPQLERELAQLELDVRKVQ